jgi:type IV pilus assembly protein PilB
MARKKLGEMLIEAGVLTEGGLRAALAEQRRWGGTLGRTLVEMRQIKEEELVRVLSRQLGLESVDLDAIKVPQHVLELIPGELAQNYSIVPFGQQMKFLDVAMADPTNVGIIDELRIRTQLNIRHYLAGPKMIERAIARYYGRGFAVTHSRPDVQVTDQPDALDLAPDLAASVVDAELTFADAAPRAHTRHRDEGVRPFPRTTYSPVAVTPRDAEIDALQHRISELEALVARDEEVLRKLLALLVEKGVATRDEIMQRLA